VSLVITSKADVDRLQTAEVTSELNEASKAEAVTTLQHEDAEDGRVSVETVEGLPVRLVEAYADLACRHARVRQVDPGVWFATVVGLEGAWGDGATEEEALQSLREAIIGWVAVKRRLGIGDIPPMEGMNLNPPETKASESGLGGRTPESN
jgi:predicted RNase H-like HicB family nuclease